MFEITRLSHAIHVEHQCTAQHARSRVIVEKARDGTIWRGTVHVFNLSGHPHADCCYAWFDKRSGGSTCTTVLKVGLVKSAQTAVRAALRARQAITLSRTRPRVARSAQLLAGQ